VPERLGGFSDLKYCHDWDFIMRAAECFELSFLPRPLYSYRLHGANSFKSLEGLARRESHIVAHGVRDRGSREPADSLSWRFGCLGLLASWQGYR
jgi:hypothetical protein